MKRYDLSSSNPKDEWYLTEKEDGFICKVSDIISEIEKVVSDLEYSAYNLTKLQKDIMLKKGIIESTCPEETLLITIRNLKALKARIEGK